MSTYPLAVAGLGLSYAIVSTRPTDHFTLDDDIQAAAAELLDILRYLSLPADRVAQLRRLAAGGQHNLRVLHTRWVRERDRDTLHHDEEQADWASGALLNPDQFEARSFSSNSGSGW